jgi:predicted nuclease of predicted toxin-antitoxin system
MEWDWEELDVELVDKKYLPSYPKKIKLLADENISQVIIEDLSQYFSIKSVFDLNLAGHPDENVRATAKKLNRVILTTDKDFWDEKKHPIRKCFGIICTEAGPSENDKFYHSLARFHIMFAKKWPLEWWENTKAFIKMDGFILRSLQYDGNIEETEYKFKNGKVFFR